MKWLVFLTILASTTTFAVAGDSNKEKEKKKKEKKSGGGGGDPHFRTYDGTQYSYHGKCDLVMARSESFGNGLGLDVHARTDITNSNSWSLISNAAVRIGSDIFELSSYDGTYYVNGIANPPFPLALENHYIIEKSVNKMGDGEETFYSIHLNGEDKIHISLWQDMISVRVDADLHDTEGMLGVFHKDGMIGRDRETILEDPNEMGQQWQVTAVEPMLFHDVRAPQYPERCTLPSVDTRRLKVHTTKEIALAEQACADVEPHMKKFCKEDVLITGDYKLGSRFAYSF